jgi:hypothetical protein
LGRRLESWTFIDASLSMQLIAVVGGLAGAIAALATLYLLNWQAD